MQSQPTWWKPLLEQVAVASIVNMSGFNLWFGLNQSYLKAQFEKSGEIDAAHWHQVKFENDIGLLLPNGKRADQTVGEFR